MSWTLYRAREGRGFVSQRIEMTAYIGIEIIYGMVCFNNYFTSNNKHFGQLIFPDEMILPHESRMAV